MLTKKMAKSGQAIWPANLTLSDGLEELDGVQSKREDSLESDDSEAEYSDSDSSLWHVLSHFISSWIPYCISHPLLLSFLNVVVPLKSYIFTTEW